ncbi:hypothetical protein, partial [Klebsiella pneumoniae]|uniref:hypothetical protein n=1 Tax=Klebsiella pneumoniae TaxID=573 RepID=UPI00196406EA
MIAKQSYVGKEGAEERGRGEKIIFIETVRLISNEDIKKSCALCDVCGNSLGIPSNKKPESIEN